MIRAFIGIGSNQGDRLAIISRAIRALGAVPGVQVAQMATIIETAPVGGPPQDPYLNTAVEVSTTLTPRELLTELQRIERELGRVPSPERWGPRPIDLDILLYGDDVVNEPDLQIPHPRLHERQFVLEPMVQLACDAVHPVLHQTVGMLLASLGSPERSCSA